MIAIREQVSRGVVRHIIGDAIGVRFDDDSYACFAAFPRDDMPGALVGDRVAWARGCYDTRFGQRVTFSQLRREPHPLADHGNGD